MRRENVTAMIDFSRFGATDERSRGSASVAAQRPGTARPAALGLGAGATRGPRLDFDQLYEAHFDFVWRSLRLLGVDDHALEDAAQDTFSVVSRQLASFEGRSAPKTWLFAILQRVAANYRRRRRRKQAPLTALSDTAGEEPTPLAHVEAAEAARFIESFCESLAPERRALFVLAVIEDVPAAEVAATLELPIAKVYSRVHSLREGLKRALAARGSRRG